MYYFAYDDKMYTPVLNEILDEFTCLGPAYIEGHRLYFHKLSEKDKSGKCNIIKVNDLTEKVHGVLYDIPARKKHLLDKAEGLGFGSQETTVKITTSSGDNVFAFTFIANTAYIMQDLVPYQWYKALLVGGAKEHQLPEKYINSLQAHASQPDQNPIRLEQAQKLLFNAPPS